MEKVKFVANNQIACVYKTDFWTDNFLFICLYIDGIHNVMHIIILILHLPVCLSVKGIYI